ncbi:UNVERIFIED_CONTAM: RHOMBOID-like protein 3 [Sesamum calycinum]|uniref:RHOMBOID-like protein n=1 Tax=Sesamum calycinum TaxID=2727403 RepID=A0AAW2LZT8_9LAMI
MVGNGDLERGTATKNRNQSYPQTYYAAGGGRVYDMEYSDSQWTSWLVPMIVVANVAMFVVIMFVNNCPKNHDGLQGRNSGKFHGAGGCVFAWMASSALRLEKLGALEWNKNSSPEPSMEAHNLYLAACWCYSFTCKHAEFGVGIRLEQQFGFIRVGLVYLLSGIGGSILSALFIHRSISVGASGALFGLLGAMLSELLTNWTIYTNKAAALFTLVVIIAINLAVGILPHVDNFAHIGGFLSGFLLGFILLIRPQFGWLEQRNRPAETRLKSKYTVYQYVFWIIASLLLIVGFTVGLVMLFKGENGNDKCSWCHYLSCVPTSRWSCNN